MKINRSWSGCRTLAEYTVHCDNIAHIIANAIDLTDAKEKIKLYLESVGNDDET